MAEQQSTIALNMALFALLSFTLHFQAQGEGMHTYTRTHMYLSTHRLHSIYW